MASPETTGKIDEGRSVDLLAVLRASGVLPSAQVDQLQARVQAGQLPADAIELAHRLVRDDTLTEYQANRLLKKKPHGLAFGKYVILEKLGAGAMGRVYKARHMLMGRNVALKIIAPEISGNQRGIGRFRREMQLVGRLDHPNVVRAFDADQVGRTLFIVMEFVQGQTLGQFVRREGPLPVLDVISYAAQAARGLDHAHSQGIVHRDVKPSNLLLGDDGRVRVLDLGLGVLVEPDPVSGFMTADGIAVGTIDYMSPEQALGSEVDGRSDIYSLGCTIFHLITGQHVFIGETKVDRMLARVGSQPRQLTELVHDLPAGMGQVMNRFLARDPVNRFQSAADAADALDRLLETAPFAGQTQKLGVASVRTQNLASDQALTTSEYDAEGSSEQFEEAWGWPSELALGMASRPVLSLLLMFAVLSLAFGLGLFVGLKWSG